MILKRVHRERFTQIATAALEDKRLSWTAKGVLTYIMSRPEDWQILLDHLATVSTDKKHSTRQAVHELMALGYVQREQIRDGNGKFGKYEYIVSDIPKSDFPLSDFPTAENQTLLIKDYNDKEIKKKENTYNLNLHTHSENNFSKKEEVLVFTVGFNDFQPLCEAILPDIDSLHYFKKITNYTLSKSILKTPTEWLAYIRLWIEEDMSKGKAKLLKKPKTKFEAPETEAHEKVMRLAKNVAAYQSLESMQGVIEKLRTFWAYLDEKHREIAKNTVEILQTRLDAHAALEKN